MMHLINLWPSSPVLFYDFFPEFGHVMGQIFTSECESEIREYHAATNASQVARTGYATVNCLYSISDAAIQINFAGTGVLLGLLPTILSTLGSNTWETALLSTRRPLLSFLLALGAPVVTPARLFVSTDPREFLDVCESKRLKLPRPTKLSSRGLLCLVEYALALAAIANVTSIALQLSVMAVSIGVAPVSQRYPWLLWTYIAAAIHVFGLLAFCCRFPNALSPRAEEASRSKWKSFSDRVGSEFQLCSQHAVHPFLWRCETLSSFSLSAWVSALIVAHILYGTTLFSTTQLVLGIDAVGIIARYMASAIVCRAVLIYELHGLRDTSRVEAGDGGT